MGPRCRVERIVTKMGDGLALLNEEPGAEVAEEAIPGAIVSTVIR